MRMPRKIILLGLIVVITACSRGDGALTRQKKPGDGPDEFAIVPGLPLQEPTSYTALPTPTPGQANLTDQNPRADGIAALGGNAARSSSGVTTSEAGLIRHTGRYGTQAGIRDTLRIEDEEIRAAYGRRNLLRIGPRDDYTEAYKKQWLDSQAERERLRRSGVITPTAPPAPD